MQNHKKQDTIYVNVITSPDEDKAVSNKPVGNADENSFCIYANKRHAVGSKIINRDGSETVCTEHGWENC